MCAQIVQSLPTNLAGSIPRNKNESEYTMSASDKISNTSEDLKGKAKEAIGHATNDDAKVAEGKSDQVKADAKKAGENVKDLFKH